MLFCIMDEPTHYQMVRGKKKGNCKTLFQVHDFLSGFQFFFPLFQDDGLHFFKGSYCHPLQEGAVLECFVIT